MDPTSFLAPGTSRPEAAKAIRDRIERLTAELAEGRLSDPGRALRSDFSRIALDEHGLVTLGARAATLASAETWTDRVASTVGWIADRHGALMTEATAAFGGENPAAQSAVAAQAEGLFRDMVSSLNASIGGRALFANGAGDPPMGGGEGILAALRPIAAAAADPNTLVQDFDDFFAPGGSFETVHLSAFDVAPVRFGTGGDEAVAIRVDLDDPALRGALRDAALVALMNESPARSVPGAAVALRTSLLERLGGTSADLTTLQARIGSTEARLSRMSADLEAEALNRERAISDALGADPFETATRLQAEMGRLESIYAITARRARLTLTGFLR